ITLLGGAVAAEGRAESRKGRRSPLRPPRNKFWPRKELASWEFLSLPNCTVEVLVAPVSSSVPCPVSSAATRIFGNSPTLARWRGCRGFWFYPGSLSAFARVSPAVCDLSGVRDFDLAGAVRPRCYTSGGNKVAAR